MAARRIFMMHNKYDQGRGYDRVGICTCASMQWVKQTLKRGRGLGSYDELFLTSHQMNGVMRRLRTMDSDPTAQSALMDLVPVGKDINISTPADALRHMSATAPHIGIIWNMEHTMALRTGKETEFFDNENGLWFSRTAKDIQTKMEQHFKAEGYPSLVGMRILKLM